MHEIDQTRRSYWRKCSTRTREASGRSNGQVWAMHVPVHCFYAPVFAAVLAPTDAAAAAAAAAAADDDDCPVAAVATTVATAERGVVLVALPAAPRVLVVAGALVKKLDMDGCFILWPPQHFTAGPCRTRT
jgi:hypothetical protein